MDQKLSSFLAVKIHLWGNPFLDPCYVTVSHHILGHVDSMVDLDAVLGFHIGFRSVPGCFAASGLELAAKLAVHRFYFFLNEAGLGISEIGHPSPTILQVIPSFGDRFSCLHFLTPAFDKCLY